MHLTVRDTSEERVNKCNVKDLLTFARCPRCKHKTVQSLNIQSVDACPECVCMREKEREEKEF